MKLDRIVLRQIRMPLVHFFETSFGRTTERHMVLVEAVGEGASGWGEVTAGEHPFYNEEWTHSAWHILRDYAAPLVLGRKLACAAQVSSLTQRIRGHLMARGGLEAAVWDLEARLAGEPLWKHIQSRDRQGAFRKEIPCGVSIGIQDSVPQLIEKIERELAAGYQRIKMKIKPGWDVEVVAEVRERFPNIKLMADANSAYTLADAARLKELDRFYLMMIEQPLSHDEIIDHAQLQSKLDTPICLDECIRSAHHAEQAIRMRACGIINIKLGRVGGFAEAKRVHDVAQAAGIPVWCGGMLEAGIGRAHNIALSTLPNFLLPGDVSASKRYWARDIITPPVETTPRGTILVRDEPGFGYGLDHEFISQITVREETIALSGAGR
jgi:O-succinylbenzoate synthase